MLNDRFIHSLATMLFIILLLQGCSNRPVETSAATLFTLLPEDSTNIHFINEIIEDENVNPLEYENSYNGGGVAIGDVNNDGWDDIYLTSNTKGNRLYLNKGAFHFQDVTASSGVAGRLSWTTGVTMADVNGDGLLDLYVCHSGNLPGPLRANELFINKGVGKNGIPAFAEQAAVFGLADTAFSNHSAFFDYDIDGDLDMILLNHSPIRFNNLDETTIQYLLNKTDSLTGLKFYRNDNGFFNEVTPETGIRNARLNFNLGVSVADVNNDGLQDIYISNDYLSPDYLYINKGNGRFTDELSQRLDATSQFSMGNDIADINNDGLQDIFTLDMLPEDNRRQKLLFSSDNFELFELRVKTGLHEQYMRNMLHLNNGNGSFSEIGQLAGVSNTDWSWAPLFADFDNDGWKDLFVSNGYLRDYTNMDFLKFMGDYLNNNQAVLQKAALLDLVKKMPASDVRNYAFKNKGGIQFSDNSAAWGLDAVSNSNGAAYSDLDNDGDLDLVVCNINKAAFIYRNNTPKSSKHHFLRLKLEGEKNNSLGIGASVEIFYKGGHQVQQQLVSRGFQSSVSPILLFGLGDVDVIDSVVVKWVGNKRQMITQVEVNQDLVIKQKEAIAPGRTSTVPPVFTLLPSSPIPFIHRENQVNDFKRQPLLLNPLSYNGPCMAKADINGDGLDDLFTGAAAGFPGAVYLQKKRNSFYELSQPDLQADAAFEDIASIFVDVNNDNHPDLFVASGGYDHFMPGDPLLQPRLYINDGKGRLSRDPYAVPRLFSSAGTVAAGDINGDGYPDIFLGGRVVPGRYPEAPSSFILLNNGKGSFTDATSQVCPEIAGTGMFTSAVFSDLDADGLSELITAGEWLPVQIWKIKNGRLSDQTNFFLEHLSKGWWNTLEVKDINRDGRPDIIAGNFGWNCQWRATDKKPVEMYYKDFDDNGAVDPIFCYYIKDTSWPYAGRDELLDQVSTMRGRFPDYKSYAHAQLENIFTPEEMKDAKTLTATTMETTVWVSLPSGKYVEKQLPVQAQFSPVFAISVGDFNNDGSMDLLLGGNVYHARMKSGLSRASQGQLFFGDGSGSFKYVSQRASGLGIRGDVRSYSLFGDLLFAGINEQPLQAYRFNQHKKK